MPHLYDFGIAQEDPLTELHVLDIQPGDHVLCVASGGEIPLSLLCLQPDIKITAVDISPNQLTLCRLKLKAALALPAPLNGAFLGFSPCEAKERHQIYINSIRPELSEQDQRFWDTNLLSIENGVINAGRFEGYIKTIRKILTFIIGKKNILELIACEEAGKQQALYDRQIGGRKALEYLFHIAFHPALYKKRGIRKEGLQHAPTNTGEIFLSKFRDFCTATPANRNYFLQYMLNGACTSAHALPEYCHSHFQPVLRGNIQNITFIHSSLQEVVKSNLPGTFTKIHLSNVGDWMSEKGFIDFATILHDTFSTETIACYRYLQKNHLHDNALLNKWFAVTQVKTDTTDRFPFYTTLSLRRNE